MPDTLTSLRSENNTLKLQPGTLSGEAEKLKQLLNPQQCVFSDANGENISATTEEEKAHSLQFMSQKYDDLHRFQTEAKDELHRLRTQLAQVQSKLNRISNAIDQLEDYSYQFNVKLIGVPEMSTTESASSTSSFCVKIFNEMGADVSILDIETAHKVPTRSDQGSGPKPIICKFLRRLAKEQGMECRNDVINVNPTAIGLPEQTSISAVRIFDHLTPKMQTILYEVKRFKTSIIINIAGPRIPWCI